MPHHTSNPGSRKDEDRISPQEDGQIKRENG